MTQKCPPGKYYCNNDKKCKPIPRGYHVTRTGYLEKDEDKKMEMAQMVMGILAVTVAGTATVMGVAMAVMVAMEE